MTAITSFSNSDFQSLTIWKDEAGREYFRAVDVCANLRHSNPNQALQRHVNEEYIIKINDGTNRGGLTNYLSEPGLYQLIFASRTDWAKRFQKWVFEEVLPKLRRGEAAIVSTPQQAITIATPNTSISDRAHFLYRDGKVMASKSPIITNQAN